MRLISWRKAGLTAVLALGLLGAPRAASAGILATYTPADSDMEDLDHHSLYAWRMEYSGATIGGATITIQNILNWDTNWNILQIWLLNDALLAGTSMNGGAVQELNPALPCTAAQKSGSAGCVTEFIDDSSTTPNQASSKDDFGLPRTLSGTQKSESPGWLVSDANMLTAMELTARSFAGPGQAPSNGGGWIYDAAHPQTIANPNGTGGTVTVYDYTYTFTAAQVSQLNTFLNGSDNAFALGIDPDCHFFNDGITLTLYDVTGGQATPEPASMLLLGTGLVFLARRRLTAKAKA